MELSKADTASVKGIAILLMLWHHLFMNAPGYGMLTHSFAVISKVCVALFLFVSGYGLTKQFSGLERHTVESSVKLLSRRFVNFYMQYWFCFFLVVLIGNICGYSFNDAYPATRNVFKCITLDVFGQMGYDSYLKSWWFNKMIIQLWLVFPILYLLVSNKYSALLGLIAITFLQLYAKRIPGNIFFLVEGGTPAFFLGMFFAHHPVSLGKYDKQWKGILLAISIIMILGLSFLLLKVIKDPYQAIIIRALLALCIVYTLSACREHCTTLTGFLGKYATIMYLTHVLLIVLIPGINSFLKHSFPVFLVFTVACCMMAIIIDWLKTVTGFDKLRLALIEKISRI